MQRVPHQARTPITKDTADAELAKRAACGDDAAFEAIMRRYNRRLFRTARSVLNSDVEAEDALQDAYLHAWRAMGSFRAEAQLSTWLVRIVVNEAAGRLRRKKAQLIPLDTAMTTFELSSQASLADEPDQAPDLVAMRAQLRVLLEARIDLLPEIFRTVFMLRAIEEMSVEEVSQALEIPESTVRTRYFRARSLMREGLAREIDVALSDAFAFDGARCDRVVAAVLVSGRTDGLSTHT
ncbi:RNA polymerase sigma factor [Dyella psychrodurans]|uniref:RNA polymerase sigma factor n=1 Tax=Dyella psychrodurans TaxID=1927960 RepID=A0A370X0S1_9GAMM|nr:RNA polymerase sigma factor [Dyella psychrodurans]RDS81805.1 RNA polymerase sigma factor [Dyella psychrodurans]